MPTDPAVIVIPLHHRGGKFKTDLELRFSLRALEKNFVGEKRVVIVGRKLPDWIQGVEHLEVKSKGLKKALSETAASFPDGFFWYYDDCVMLKPTTAAQLKKTPAPKRWSRASGTRWGKMLEKVRLRLVAEGLPCRDYSRPHGPYFFDKSMVDESYQDWPGMKGKFPFESWILNKREWPCVHGAVKQYYGDFKNPPSSKFRYLNYNDRGNSLGLRTWLRKTFPEPCRFETNDEMTKEKVYALQSRHIHNAWQEIGSPPLRTICECAVGPFSLLQRFEGVPARTILIEPDPTMARAARERYPWAELLEVAVTGEFGTVNLRKLHGSSYVKGIRWAPAFKSLRKKARRAGKVTVAGVPFTVVDDGKIDLINLDCEGSEWSVLKDMKSRPLLIQIELYKAHGYYQEISQWLEENKYKIIARWGNANLILHREE